MLKKTADITMKALIILSIWLWILTFIKPELVKDFLSWIKEVVNSLWYWNYLIIFVSSLIESFPVLWVVIPGQNILFAVWWFFAETSRINLIYVIIVTSIWAILWNFIWFYLWKVYWDEFFRKYWLWFWIWETEVKYLKKWIEKWWAWGIIFGKFHNLTRAFVPFIAWTMWMKSKIFMIYNVIGSIIRAIIMIILGTIFASYYEKVVDNFGKIMLAIFVISAFYIYKFKKKEFMEYMDEKNKEIDKKMWYK